MTDPALPDGAAPPGEPHNPVVSHETSDANLRGIVMFAVALAVVVAVALVVLAWIFHAFKAREDRDKASRFPLSAPERVPLPQPPEFSSPATGVLPDAPRLEGLNLQGPGHDVGRTRRQGTGQAKNEDEEKQLGEAGAARISIEQAMRLVAAESKPKGHEPAPVHYDQGVAGKGGGSDSGQTLPEARR